MDSLGYRGGMFTEICFKIDRGFIGQNEELVNIFLKYLGVKQTPVRRTELTPSHLGFTGATLGGR